MDARATAVAPTYDEGKVAPLSMDRSGSLRVSGAGGQSYVLLNNATANGPGSQTAKVRKDRYGFTVENYGTGTASIAVEQLGANGSTWIPSRDSGGNPITFTVAAASGGLPSSQTKVYDVMQDSILRAVVSGTTPPVSIYMTMG